MSPQNEAEWLFKERKCVKTFRRFWLILSHWQYLLISFFIYIFTTSHFNHKPYFCPCDGSMARGSPGVCGGASAVPCGYPAGNLTSPCLPLPELLLRHGGSRRDRADMQPDWQYIKNRMKKKTELSRSGCIWEGMHLKWVKIGCF